MLDPWIIEKIRRREEERSRDGQRRLELPLESPVHTNDDVPTDEVEKRGVVVIDL